MKAYAHNNFASQTLDLTVVRQYGARRAFVMPQVVVFKTEEATDDFRLHEYSPSFRWQYDMAEAIFQSLWDAGYRPAKGQGGAAEVEALKNHIAFAEKVAEKALEGVPRRLSGKTGAP